MLRWLEGSKLIRNEMNGKTDYRGEKELIQDRYSLRCLAQYMGPIVEGIATVTRQVETEINSATDNPLLDPEREASYHGGNFLGQYIGVGMDQLRYYVGLLAKHVDVQISLVAAPEFSGGLPPSLVGNTARKVNTGIRALQLTGNSIMPLLTFMGNSLADRFPSHAEQFNQNINSQGFGSANLARQSVEMFRQYLATAALVAVQAVDIRTNLLCGHFDARTELSGLSRELYVAVKSAVGKPPSKDRPLIWNDNEQPLDRWIADVAGDLRSEGPIVETLAATLAALP
jgi:phenylalanine ammonia-lyase